MAELQQGQHLPCGCVVGAYWCGPHDIYARRTATSQTWGFATNGTGFCTATAERNDHCPMSDFTPIRSSDDYDGDYGSSCSCHINPPCAHCTRECDEEGVEHGG